MSVDAVTAGLDGGALRSAPVHVLVVDDVEDNLLTTQFLLARPGLSILTANSGAKALELLEQHEMALMLLDVQMPKMNGFETCVRLHEAARAAKRCLKIWFMTGINYRELLDDCSKAGGIGVFHKPFDWPQLLADLDHGFGTGDNRPPAPGQ